MVCGASGSVVGVRFEKELSLLHTHVNQSRGNWIVEVSWSNCLRRSAHLALETLERSHERMRQLELVSETGGMTRRRR